MAGGLRTSNDLVTETLARLGVLAAGQPTDPEDFSYVSTMLDSTFRKIAALEIVYVPNQDQIPGEWFSDLADILAGECATKFGATNDDFVKLVNKGLGGVNGVDVGQGAAAKSLRAIRRNRATGEILVVDYI